MYVNLSRELGVCINAEIPSDRSSLVSVAHAEGASLLFR